MRPLPALATALVLCVAAAGCSDDELDEATGELSDAAGEVGEAVTDAASEVADAAGDASELVGYCTAAYRFQDAVEDRNPDDALEAAEDLAAEAPDDIRDEVETVLDGARAYQGGDEQALGDEEFQAAASAVADDTAERCDPRS
ncbi:MAG: hypothetical protein KY461_07025 [Actinobacteria bacterium]|nr:hypothetical protein [Actinomycetota bacterium]